MNRARESVDIDLLIDELQQSREQLIRVLVADDHPLLREGVRNVVDNTEGMIVVGEAATGEEAVNLAMELQPDVILMDIRMPGLNGIEATAQLLMLSS